MKYTKEFKDFVEKLFKENDADCLQISLVEDEDNSVSINFGIMKTDDETPTKDIDGVKTMIDEDTEEALTEAIFSSDGEQILVDFECDCHDDDCCCHGEHHHHHEGECCHDGCCCGDEE